MSIGDWIGEIFGFSCRNLWYFSFVLLACVRVCSLFNGLLATLFSLLFT